MSFKTYLKQRLQVEKDIASGKIKIDEVYAGTTYKEEVSSFIAWLQENGIFEINDGNVENIFNDYGLFDEDFVDDYWDEIVSQLRNAGIFVNLTYDN